MDDKKESATDRVVSSKSNAKNKVEKQPVIIMMIFTLLSIASYFHILSFADEKWNYIYDVAAPNFTGTQDEFRQILLEEYNRYRRMRNLSDLKLSDNLNSVAERYVNTYINDPDVYFTKMKYELNTSPALLVTPYVHPKLVAMSFYEERNFMEWKDYPHINVNSSRNALHFTAMIWKSGQSIGSFFRGSRTIPGCHGIFFIVVSVIYQSPLGINAYNEFGNEIVPLPEEIAPYI